VVTIAERGLWLPEPADRGDLLTFAERALRLDEAAVVRLRFRSDGTLTAWVATGFDVLASRVIHGRLRPDDVSAGADALVRGLSRADPAGAVDPGYPMDSAWRGVLPPTAGFVHLDDVPARVLRDLAQHGADVAREYADGHGPPSSLLDQEVIGVSTGELAVGVPMRCLFALTAMGFVPQPASADVVDHEVVRVRAMPAWLRLDARYGSVYCRRGHPSVVLR